MLNTILSSIILGLALFLILFFNSYAFKNKKIKYLYILFSLVFLLLIIILDNSFIYEFLKTVIKYLWYPNYLLFVISVLCSIILLLYTLLKKEMFLINRVINYLLFCISYSCYLIFISFDIDPLLYSSLYQDKSLIVMRIETITFLITLIINIILKIRGSNEK